MNQQHTATSLTEGRRREIFLALVELQDRREMTMPESREVICERYGIDVGQRRAIEREGLENDWPPFSRESPGAADTPDAGGPALEDDEDEGEVTP